MAVLIVVLMLVLVVEREVSEQLALDLLPRVLVRLELRMD